jgi:hypothetical protein
MVRILFTPAWTRSCANLNSDHTNHTRLYAYLLCACSVDEIAQANVDLFKRVMPIAVRSANFLSGGQSLADASARLSVMNQKKGNLPVNLSFSWSAALQVRLRLWRAAAAVATPMLVGTAGGSKVRIAVGL